MKRIKRKRLKEDEFVTTVNKIVRFVKKRTKELMALGIAILVLVVIVVVFNFIKAQNVKKESRLVGQIFELRSQLDENPEKVTELEKMAGNRKFSRLACILLATYRIENGDFDKAQEVLDKIKKSEKDIFYYQAQDLLAQIHMKKGNYDKVIEIYSKIEKENPRVYSLDAVLFHRAEAHEKKGEKEEALALYKRIQEQFPQRAYAFDASQKISKLEEEK